MKKLIFLALVATALFVSSCGKDDDNGGGSTSLNGDWYTHTIYTNFNGQGFRWSYADACSDRSHWSIFDKKIKDEWYGLDNNNNCKHTSTYYDYTISNGTLNMTVAKDSPDSKSGDIFSVKYEMKDKELIFRYKSEGYDVINVLHKKGENYSYLDPFIGVWNMTKYVVGQQELIVKDGECLDGQIVASSLGATLYLNYPENGQCNKTINSYKWVKEGGKYYNVSNPAEKTLWDISFSNNNRYMTFAIDNGRTVMHFTKVK